MKHFLKRAADCQPSARANRCDTALHASDAWTWCFVGLDVWTGVPQKGRDVIMFFSDKWMVYDKYDHLVPRVKRGHPQLCAPCHRPDVNAVSGASASDAPGPIPNTVYKSSTDPYSDLELTQDSIAYYEESYTKRRAAADLVRADAGEGEFKLTESIRVTWIQAKKSRQHAHACCCSRNPRGGYRGHTTRPHDKGAEKLWNAGFCRKSTNV